MLDVLHGENEGSFLLIRVVIYHSFDHIGSMEAYSCFITSLISYQTHSGNKSAISPPATITGKAMTYEDVVTTVHVWRIPQK